MSGIGVDVLAEYDDAIGSSKDNKVSNEQNIKKSYFTIGRISTCISGCEWLVHFMDYALFNCNGVFVAVMWSSRYGSVI